MERELWGVMALDPGATTGVVNAVVPVSAGGVLIGDSLSVLERGRSAGYVSARQLSGPWKQQVSLFVQMIVKGDQWLMSEAERLGYARSRQAVVMEGFELTAGHYHRDVLVPHKIQSALEWVLAPPVVHVVCVQNRARKAQVPDARLKQWGWYSPGRPHANDAMRHLIVFLRSLAAGRLQEIRREGGWDAT